MSRPPLGFGILVADSDPVFGRLLKRVLSGLGNRVDLCEDGETALEYLDPSVHSLVIVDARVFGRNGLEVIREMRSRGIDLPVLFLTRTLDEDTRRRLREVDPASGLRKPFSIADLLKAIRDVRRAAVSRQASALAQGEPR